MWKIILRQNLLTPEQMEKLPYEIRTAFSHQKRLWFFNDGNAQSIVGGNGEEVQQMLVLPGVMHSWKERRHIVQCVFRALDKDNFPYHDVAKLILRCNLNDQITLQKVLHFRLINPDFYVDNVGKVCIWGPNNHDSRNIFLNSERLVFIYLNKGRKAKYQWQLCGLPCNLLYLDNYHCQDRDIYDTFCFYADRSIIGDADGDRLRFIDQRTGMERNIEINFK